MAIRVTGKTLQGFLLILALAVVGLRIYAHSRFESSVDPSRYQHYVPQQEQQQEAQVPLREDPPPAPQVEDEKASCLIDYSPMCETIASLRTCGGSDQMSDYVRTVCPDTCKTLTPSFEPKCISEDKISSSMPWRPTSITTYAKLLANEVVDGKSSASTQEDSKWRERMTAVQGAFNHSFVGYMQYAWGTDTLKPISRHGMNNMGNMGATIIDSLDTMLIMGLEDSDMYRRSVDWVNTTLKFNNLNGAASTFETNIRVLGGLLAAFDLSGGEPLYLERAIDLGNRLLWAFDTQFGLPVGQTRLGDSAFGQRPAARGAMCLAEVGTMQLEFIALSERSGDKKYAEAAVQVIDILEMNNPANGLIATMVTPDGHSSGSFISFGGMGDSYYEYLLKVWVYGGRDEKVKRYLDMWEKSIKGMHDVLWQTTPRGYHYLKEGYQNTMGHLACFTAGMLAYGASDLDNVQFGKEAKLRNYSEAGRTMGSAKDLMDTCWKYYHFTPSHLSGEEAIFNAANGEADWRWKGTHNLQRPEVVESLFYLWRLTGDKSYREAGWEIFEAFQETKIPSGGYSGVRNVETFRRPKGGNIENAGFDDEQQTFWLAETLKYFYLLFAPVELIPLTDYVFNTEAHPVMIQPKDASTHFRWANVVGPEEYARLRDGTKPGSKVPEVKVDQAAIKRVRDLAMRQQRERVLAYHKNHGGASGGKHMRGGANYGK